MVSWAEAIALSVLIVGMAVIIQIGNQTGGEEGRNEGKRGFEGRIKKGTGEEERKVAAAAECLVALDKRLMALESKLDDALIMQARIQENLASIPPRKDRGPLE